MQTHYADDTTLILDGSPETLNEVMRTLKKFRTGVVSKSSRKKKKKRKNHQLFGQVVLRIMLGICVAI